MESATAIRSQPMVATYDTVDVCADYGLKVVDPVLLGEMKAVLAELVRDADTRITQHFAALKELNQNPYAEAAYVDGQEIQHAAVVRLFNDDLGAHIARRLHRLPLNLAKLIDLSKVTDKTIVLLSELLDRHGYELAAASRHEGEIGIASVAIRDPIYVREAPAVPTQEDNVKLRGDIGFRSPCTASQLRGARAVADAFCNEALSKVEEYLRVMSAGGGSPFGEGYQHLERATSVIVDSARVRDSNCNVVDRGSMIAVGVASELSQRLTNRVGSRVTIDDALFRAFVVQNLADRLSERPELMAALVGTQKISDSLRNDHAFRIICAPEPPPPPPPAPEPPSEPSRFARLVARLLAPFTAFSQQVRAALPAPPEEPKALPPPPPEVVPPITTGRYASTRAE